MAEHSFPFDANYVDGRWDRVFNSEKDRQRYGGLVGNGVFVNPANNLQVMQKTGMNIEVKPGKAWINGGFYINDASKQLTIDNADPVLNRIDTIVLKFDLSARMISLSVKKGTPSSVAKPPVLTQESNTHELGLADIYIGFGSGKITQANITDTRQDNLRCGIVKGLIDQIDTTDLFAQYKKAFEEWFDEVKGQLSGDVAGQLASQISQLNNNKQNKTDDELKTSQKNIVGAINSLVSFKKYTPTLSTNAVDEGVNFRKQENGMVFFNFVIRHNGAGFNHQDGIATITNPEFGVKSDKVFECLVLVNGEYRSGIIAFVAFTNQMTINFTGGGKATHIRCNSFYFTD